MKFSPYTRDLRESMSPMTAHGLIIQARSLLILGRWQDGFWELLGICKMRVVTLITLYTSLIRNKVEYYCPLWNPSQIKDIQSLENFQKEFTRRISGLQDCD